VRSAASSPLRTAARAAPEAAGDGDVELEFLQHYAAPRPGCPTSADGWRFLHAYPQQYVAQKLGANQPIVIDGSLSDAAWEEVPFTDSPFVDIAQPLFPDYVLPEKYATKVKVRWDADFLYVAAVLSEPWVEHGFVWGSNPTLRSSNPIGNSNVPYYDNDFEVFIDVSGTNYYYKEFEMNYNNATYDVLWRAPDGGIGSTGVPCCVDNKCERWCQNSSWPAFGGTFSMSPNMKTATAKVDGGWSLEIAFPLRQTNGVGGLLSGGADWGRFDPNLGTKFWLADFSRAEHPFFVSDTALFAELCPVIQKAQPTLLGTDQWSCYWEWTWQSIGGHKYMHNPDNFGFLQFASNPQEPLCGNIEWPARYVLAQIYQAQVAYVQEVGKYSSQLAPLLQKRYCSVANACNVTDLQAVVTTFKDMFHLKIDVDNSATHCVKYGTSQNYTGGPCFTASVSMEMPGMLVKVRGSIKESRYLDVAATSDTGDIPCLTLI